MYNIKVLCSLPKKVRGRGGRKGNLKTQSQHSSWKALKLFGFLIDYMLIDWLTCQAKFSSIKQHRDKAKLKKYNIPHLNSWPSWEAPLNSNIYENRFKIKPPQILHFNPKRLQFKLSPPFTGSSCVWICEYKLLIIFSYSFSELWTVS